MRQSLGELLPGHHAHAASQFRSTHGRKNRKAILNQIRTALVAAYNPINAQDVADHANDVTPSSLRSDKIHLNDAGYQFVAKKIDDFFKSKNWLTPTDKGEDKNNP